MILSSVDIHNFIEQVFVYKSIALRGSFVTLYAINLQNPKNSNQNA